MIKKGDKFRCIKTLIYAEHYLWYKKGKIYVSEEDECITDEEGSVYHAWSADRQDTGKIAEYFIPYISNKRKGYGRSKKRQKI